MDDDVYLDGAKVGKWLSQRQRLSRAQNAALPVTMRMETYSFAIHVTGVDLTGQYEDKFYEAGCGDATIIVIDGKLRLDFDRHAGSYKAALASAMDDVERAGALVAFVEVAP